MKRFEHFLSSGYILEIPDRELATPYDLPYVVLESLLRDDPVIVGHRDAHRLADRQNTALKREEPDRTAAVLQDAHVDVVPYGSHGPGVFRTKEGACQKRVGPLKARPTRYLVGGKGASRDVGYLHRSFGVSLRDKQRLHRWQLEARSASAMHPFASSENAETNASLFPTRELMLLCTRYQTMVNTEFHLTNIF